MEDFIDLITGIAIFIAIVVAFGKKKAPLQKKNAPSRPPFETPFPNASPDYDDVEREQEPEESPYEPPREEAPQEDVNFSYETIPEKQNEPACARTTSATSAKQSQTPTPMIIEEEADSPNVDLSEEGVKQGIIYSEIFKPRYDQ